MNLSAGLTCEAAVVALLDRALFVADLAGERRVIEKRRLNLLMKRRRNSSIARHDEGEHEQ